MLCPHCGKLANDDPNFCPACGAALNPVVAAARAEFSGDLVYAPVGHRLAAYLIDYLLFLAVLVATAFGAGTSRNPWVLLAGPVVLWLYKAGMESSNAQATLGKMALGIKVTTKDGERLSFLRSTVRTLAFIVSNSIALISLLILAVTDRRQSLHDLIAGTVVVRKERTAQEVAAAPAASGGVLGVVLVVLAGFAAVFIIGILAAIAIPAYQDYTLRSQVTAGLALATPFQNQISRAAARGVDVRSATTQSLGITAPASGPFVSDVTVNHGSVIITYGGSANSLLQNRKLVLYPVKDLSGSIVWVCGYHEIEGTRLDFPRLESARTDLPEKYLPTGCRH